MQALSGAGNLCRYGCVRDGDVEVFEVSITYSSTIGVGDGCGKLWMRSIYGVVQNLNFFELVSNRFGRCSSSMIIFPICSLTGILFFVASSKI